MTRHHLSAGMASCVLLSLALTLTAWIVPDVLGVRLLLPPGRDVVVWTVRSRAIAGIGLFCWLGALLFAWRRRHPARQPGTADTMVAPLALLPLSLIGLLVGPIVPQAAAANLLYFLPILLASLVLFRWAQLAEPMGKAPTFLAGKTVLVGISFGLFYALVGWYFTASLGPSSGDSGHYIVQAESLYRDHDLDLRNNLGSVAERKPDLMHISRFSRGGHLYSWHSFGLPLLLAPFVPGGVPARHLVLGLLSGLCCAGVWELCRLFGARTHWSLIALLLYGMSSYWGVYSSRCLPEVAGAALTTWGVVAILHQQDRPWASMGGCWACCAYLPWLHTRFLPVSLTVAALYIAYGLAGEGGPRRALPRLGTMTLAYGAALAGFAAVQFRMYEGGLPAAAGDILFSYPAGMWHAVAANQGILAVLPLFAAMAAAAFWVVARDSERRSAGLLILVLAGVVLATSSSNVVWHAGASLPGRFLVVVAPLFVPCLASALGRARPVARWWTLFLGSISCFQLLLMLARLPEFKPLSDPRGVSSRVYDHLNGLAEFFPANDGAAWHPFAVLLIGGTALLFFLESRRVRWTAVLPATMALGAVAVADCAYYPRMLLATERINAGRLAALGDRLEGARVQSTGEKNALDLFRVSDLFHPGDRFPENKLPSIAAPEPEPSAGAAASGTGQREAPLLPPFVAGAGLRACRFTGRLEGSGAHWIVREGSQTLLDRPLDAGPVDATATFRCTGSGNVSVAVRLDDAGGTLWQPAVSWTPYSPRLLETGGFRLGEQR